MASTVQSIFGLNPAASVHSLRPIYRVEPLVAGVALICALPVLLVVAAITALLARRSPLVRHRRTGWCGNELEMLKFRTMWSRDSPRSAVFTIEDVSDTIPDMKSEDDPRVTSRFASWCRRYSLDELPQLYHIARGEMSFVGPRPITAAELASHYGDDAPEVLSVRPGLTGLWQSLGRNRLTYATRRRLDVWFVRHASPCLYFRILARTIPRVLQGDNAC
jgi:lipopolysaccharide/colanic/teichoic acid biosynthesis glycosyltransferase